MEDRIGIQNFSTLRPFSNDRTLIGRSLATEFSIGLVILAILAPTGRDPTVVDHDTELGAPVQENLAPKAIAHANWLLGNDQVPRSHAVSILRTWRLNANPQLCWGRGV